MATATTNPQVLQVHQLINGVLEVLTDTEFTSDANGNQSTAGVARRRYSAFTKLQDLAPSDTYYDAAHTMLYSAFTQTAQNASGTHSELSGTGYTRSGAPYFSTSIISDITATDYNIQPITADIPNTAPYVTRGFHCTVDATSGINTCNSAFSVNIPSFQLAFADTATYTKSYTYAAQQYTVQLTSGAMTFADGPLNALTAQNANGTWQYIGAPSNQNATFTGSVTYASTDPTVISTVAAANFTFTDATNGLTTTITQSNGNFVGTVSSHTIPTLATFSMDSTGQGTVTYPDNSTSVISTGVLR